MGIVNILNRTYCENMDLFVNAPAGPTCPVVGGPAAHGCQARMNVLMSAIFAPVPLLVAANVAATSSRCDLLMDALNATAIVHGESCHLRLDYLIRALSRLNRGQGIGFVVCGIVLDRKRLRSLAFAIASGLSTLFTALLALRDDAPQHAAADACVLSESEGDIIRSLLSGRDCAFNMTLESVLDAA